MFFSIIVPVYNRPDEISELLNSLSKITYDGLFEVVIVEDGSTINCKEIVTSFENKLQISYFFKKNSGPGDSRNYAMNKAKGNYFIIFDSDCIIPPDYLSNVHNQLQFNYVDCFGGPDKALKSFSKIQKAINFAMTSFLTTGGIRGGSEKINKFQPRSFNMGISKDAFISSEGFGTIHPGEDPDLIIRLWKLGFKTRLFSDCFVYHKRRIDWNKFSLQVSKFGKARPILNHWYPDYAKITYWFPSLFIIGFFISVALLFFLIDWPLKIYFTYFLVLFIVSSVSNRSVIIGLLSVKAVYKQFFGYGFGFLQSYLKISILKKIPQDAMPELFFKKVQITKIIGLTGGIGSGKSTVANMFKEAGIPVYISDAEAKIVMEQPEIKSKIVKLFGNAIIDENNFLNRAALASIVFNQPDKLKQLNAIVHPEVKKHFDLWVKQHADSKCVIKETAILFESGSNKMCDKIITVSAPIDQRIKRVVARDQSSPDKVLQRMQSQISDEERIKKSDFVIYNNTIQETQQIVESIINKLNI